MKIALVSEHASPLAVIGGVDAGGQNVHVAALASRLAAAGHDVTVHTRRSDTGMERRVAFGDGVVVDHVPAGPPSDVGKDQMWTYMPAFSADLRAQWAADPPDLIHAHFWMSGWAALAARPLGTPVVQTFHALGVVKRRHQGSADTSPAARQRVEIDICRKADRIVATCTDEVRELVRLGADASKIDVVPCGVDLARFHPADASIAGAVSRPTRASASNGPLHRLLMVGRLVPRKGLDDAVRALAAVPGAQLEIAGGPDLSELADDEGARAVMAAARNAGVASRVTLLGRVARPDMPELIRSADLVVCPPWYEPFGIVPVEAMACGRPVVATAVGGMLDTVVDGQTGLLVPPRHPAALAAAIRRLLDDPACRQRMGQAGRRRAVQRYGWWRVGEDTAASYQTARDRAGTGVVARTGVVT